MKQEKLFEALADIGDDLVQMAEEKRYVNQWRRWGRTAACLALVVCLAALALPYMPMGCGAKQESTAEAPAMSAPMAPAEEAPAAEAKPEAEVTMEEAPAAEVPMEEAPAEEYIQDQSTGGPAEVITVWLDGQAYELLPGLVESPADLGGLLGTADSSDGRDLTGCEIYGVTGSDYIYVKVPEGWLRGIPTERPER